MNPEILFRQMFYVTLLTQEFDEKCPLYATISLHYEQDNSGASLKCYEKKKMQCCFQIVYTVACVVWLSVTSLEFWLHNVRGQRNVIFKPISKLYMHRRKAARVLFLQYERLCVRF
jgi:hypothetical protein